MSAYLCPGMCNNSRTGSKSHLAFILLSMTSDTYSFLDHHRSILLPHFHRGNRREDKESGSLNYKATTDSSHHLEASHNNTNRGPTSEDKRLRTKNQIYYQSRTQSPKCTIPLWPKQTSLVNDCLVSAQQLRAHKVANMPPAILRQLQKVDTNPDYLPASSN